jgi:3'-phosphoadenosine 5'-phosphosulfate sulfotransferase (PAPS reductase)/FAD synthetase
MENDKVKIGWFSCGVTSAIACKLAVDKYGKNNVRLFYIEIDSAHEDNERFISDCEKWIGVTVERRRCSKYRDQFEVVEKAKFVNSPNGAMCTKVLKKDVRKAIEKEVDFDGQIFGFEFSKKEINRAIRFAQQYGNSMPFYPLIDAKMTKQQCAEILLRNGIRLPKMYELGFHNNNCIGCIKGGKGYWNKIREVFPDQFNRMAKAERIAGHSCIKGKFLDELQTFEGRHEPPIVPDCGTFCEIEFAHLIDKNTEKILDGSLSISQLKLF